MAETHIIAKEGCCFTPQSLRLLNQAIACEQGVSFDGAYGGPPLFVSAEGGGRAVIVNSGSAFVQGLRFAGEGMYFVSNDAPVTLMIPPGDAADPRCDLIVARIPETGTGCWELAVIEGVPSPQPDCPAVPESSLLLAEVTSPAGSGSIEQGDIRDARVSYSTCTGEGNWQDYTPTFNTTGVELTYGRYTRVGDTVHVRVRARVTNMPTDFTCSTPVSGTAELGWMIPVGIAVARRDDAVGAQVFKGHVINDTSGEIDEVTVVASDADPGMQWGPTQPFEWQDGAEIGLQFWYEAAS